MEVLPSAGAGTDSGNWMGWGGGILTRHREAPDDASTGPTATRKRPAAAPLLE